MNYKNYLAAIIAVIVLVGLFFGAEFLKQKTTPTEETNNTPAVESGVYENKDFGYRLEIPKSVVSEYKVERRGMSTLFYAPTTEAAANDAGIHYATLFAIQAVTVEQALKDKPMCDKGRQQYPYQCAEFQTPLGHNKYYYLALIGPQNAPADFVKNKTIENAMAEAKKATVFDPASKPENLTYESLAQGYTFSYPAYLEDFNFEDLDNQQISLPSGLNNSGYFNDKVLAHILPVQYCGLSGQCKNTTTNFAIYSGIVKLSQTDFLNNNVGKAATKTSIGSKTAYKYEEGAEGEGIIYYFIFNPDGRMAVFSLRYLNEQVVPKYQTVSGFIKYADQIKTTENIINNFQFTEIVK